MNEFIFSTEQRGKFKRCKELIITQYKIGDLGMNEENVKCKIVFQLNIIAQE